MTTRSNIHNRIVWLDMAKCIGIITVIALHTFGGLILKVSLSFVIPMFFVLNGITFRPSTTYNELLGNIKKSGIHLLIPPFLIWFFTTFIKSPTSYLGILTIVFQRCEDMQLGSVTIKALGILWFFSALFFSRIIFDLIHLIIDSSKIIYMVVILSIIGVILDSMKVWLPLNLDIAFAMQFFIYAGYSLKTYINKPRPLNQSLLYSAFYFAAWVLTFGMTCILTRNYLNIPAGIYPLFPLCYITAMSGSLFVIFICLATNQIYTKSKILATIGKYSMYVYCIHSIDYIYKFIWNRPVNLISKYIFRTGLDIFSSVAIILMIHIFKKVIYHLRKN